MPVCVYISHCLLIPLIFTIANKAHLHQLIKYGKQERLKSWLRNKTESTATFPPIVSSAMESALSSIQLGGQ